MTRSRNTNDSVLNRRSAVHSSIQSKCTECNDDDGINKGTSIMTGLLYSTQHYAPSLPSLFHSYPQPPAQSIIHFSTTQKIYWMINLIVLQVIKDLNKIMNRKVGVLITTDQNGEKIWTVRTLRRTMMKILNLVMREAVKMLVTSQGRCEDQEQPLLHFNCINWNVHLKSHIIPMCSHEKNLQ